MADHGNVDIPIGVIDAINEPIVADSHSPKILVPRSLITPEGLGPFVKASMWSSMRRPTDDGSFSSSLPAERAKVTE
jgi:hypothetical protein